MNICGFFWCQVQILVCEFLKHFGFPTALANLNWTSDEYIFLEIVMLYLGNLFFGHFINFTSCLLRTIAFFKMRIQRSNHPLLRLSIRGCFRFVNLLKCRIIIIAGTNTVYHTIVELIDVRESAFQMYVYRVRHSNLPVALKNEKSGLWSMLHSNQYDCRVY